MIHFRSCGKVSRRSAEGPRRHLEDNALTNTSAVKHHGLSLRVNLWCTADVCRLPAGPGPCSSYVHQWYFDSENQTCKQFVYGGCGGNENRFQTREDCHRKCSPTGWLSTICNWWPSLHKKADITVDLMININQLINQSISQNTFI